MRRCAKWRGGVVYSVHFSGANRRCETISSAAAPLHPFAGIPIPSRPLPVWLLELNEAPSFDRYADAERWSSEFRGRYASNPGFPSFLKVVRRWQTDPACYRRIQNEAVRVAMGERESCDARLLLRILEFTGRTAPPLYRGVCEMDDRWSVLHRFSIGSEFDVPLASFSSSRLVAEEYAWMNAEDENGTEVIFTLRACSRAVRVDLLAPDEIHWREREWYSGGRFGVVETSVAAGTVEITIEQRAIYHVA
jgi:hypothetical protein